MAAGADRASVRRVAAGTGSDDGRGACLFERFSSQFGSAVANPYLRPERAINAEIGASTRLFGVVQGAAAIYYSWLTDALVSVRTPQNLNRRENLGSADYYGGELSADVDFGSTLHAGANYSYIHRSFDVGTPPVGNLIRPFELTDVPKHNGFAFVAWRPIRPVVLTPSIEFASDRITVTPASANGLVPIYYRTGSYINAALRVDWEVTRTLTLGLGARNLFDRNYVLTDGFPQPGRSLFAGLRARY